MMNKIFGWLVVIVVGFSLMAFSYFNYQNFPVAERWENAFMCIGADEPNSAEAAQFDYVVRDVILLPMSGRAKAFNQIISRSGWESGGYYQLNFREKVFFYENLGTDFTNEMLKYGRLPEREANEAVAGACTKNKDKVVINDIEYKIVGRLKENVRLFADSYLIDGERGESELLDRDEIEVQKACIVKLTREQKEDKEIRGLLGDAFEKSRFTSYVPLIRPGRGAFYLYFFGMFLLLLGGGFVFYNICALLSKQVTNKWLSSVFGQICKYKGLFIGCHMVYFGIVLVFILVAYFLPEVQFFLSVGIHKAVESDTGPLALAGRAYGSENIAFAAVVTFAINFLLGSVLCLTVPSMIIPGSGILIALLRASVWGLILAPSSARLSAVMLPHSFTLLLEGEGYVVATFFGLLIPVYLFSRIEGENIGKRYVKGLLLNIKGNVLVGIVLVIAAVYEAISVILMMKLR